MSRKQFKQITKMKYIELVNNMGLDYTIISFICEFEEKYNYYYLLTIKQWKNRNPATHVRRLLKNWIMKYNLNGKDRLVSKTGKAKKTNLGRKKKVTINVLLEHDRDFYQEVMEEILKDHGIKLSVIVEEIKNKKEKEDKEPENKSLSANVFKINRTSIYTKYKLPSKPKIKALIKHNVEGLIEWIWLEIINSDYVIGKDKLYHKYKNTVYQNISSYVFRLHFDETGYSSRAYTKSKNFKPKENKYKNGVWANDYVNSNFKSGYFGEVLHADISYIKVKSTFYYLHVIKETFSNQILSWSFTQSRTSNGTIKLVEKAINDHRISPRIFHSDHGMEYANHKFKNFLDEKEILQSISPKGNFLANRPSEYFFALIKREKLNLYDLTFINKDLTYNLITEYIDWYNHERVQSNLKYKTPYHGTIKNFV